MKCHDLTYKPSNPTEQVVAAYSTNIICASDEVTGLFPTIFDPLRPNLNTMPNPPVPSLYGAEWLAYLLCVGSTWGLQGNRRGTRGMAA